MDLEYVSCLLLLFMFTQYIYCSRSFVPHLLTALLQTPVAFPAATSSFLFTSFFTQGEEGGTTPSWGPWKAGGLAGYDILLDAGNCLLTFACGLLSESGACVPPLLYFCLHNEWKLTGSKSRNSHTWHRAPNGRSQILLTTLFNGAPLDKEVITAQGKPFFQVWALRGQGWSGIARHRGAKEDSCGTSDRHQDAALRRATA